MNGENADQRRTGIKQFNIGMEYSGVDKFGCMYLDEFGNIRYCLYTNVLDSNRGNLLQVQVSWFPRSSSIELDGTDILEVVIDHL